MSNEPKFEITDAHVEALARHDAGGALLDWSIPGNRFVTAPQRAAFRRGFRAAVAWAKHEHPQEVQLPCHDCRGLGEVDANRDDPDPESKRKWVACPSCGGAGKFWKELDALVEQLGSQDFKEVR